MISLGRHLCSLLLGLATTFLLLGGLAVAVPADGLPARVAGALHTAVRSAAVADPEPAANPDRAGNTVATVFELRAVPRAVVSDEPVPTTPAAASTTAARASAGAHATAAPDTAAAPSTVERTTRPRAAASPTPKPAAAKATAAGGQAKGPAAAVIAATNAERAEVGCGPVRADSRLTAAAQAHAADMSARGYFSHTDRDGQDSADRIHDAGFSGSATGENIAYGQDSAAEVMAAWMDSTGHRGNILDCDYDRIGVGYDSRGDYWVQDFGG